MQVKEDNTCRKCGHEWYGNPEVGRCPSCGLVTWDVAPTGIRLGDPKPSEAKRPKAHDAVFPGGAARQIQRKAGISQVVHRYRQHL